MQDAAVVVGKKITAPHQYTTCESERDSTMNIIRLAGRACQKTRPLWEEVFSEDSKQFVDYYYEHKAPGNIGYVVEEEPFGSMLFLTPYTARVYGKTRQLSYIVGVATKAIYRHQGRMTALLMQAMTDMYRSKQPFTFLMPANPAIYEPFGFSYVYERRQWEFRDPDYVKQTLEPLMGTDAFLELEAGRLLSLRGQLGKVSSEATSREPALAGGADQEAAPDKKQKEILSRLADFANGWLETNCQIYLTRDAAYYERQLAELEAQNGDIFLLEKEGNLIGFFLYAREGEEIALQEVLETQTDSFPFLREKEERKPIIMARIIHLEEMMKLVRSRENRSVLIDVEDPLIAENEGLYLWEITPEGSRVTRQKDGREPEVRMTVEALTGHLIRGVFINEIV